MKTYNDIDSQIFLNDSYVDCSVDFEECEGEITITNARFETENNLLVDLASKAYSWLLTSDIREALEEDAQAYIKAESDHIELEAGLANQLAYKFGVAA